MSDALTEPAKLLLLTALLGGDGIVSKNGLAFIKELILRRDPRLKPLLSKFEEKDTGDNSFVEQIHDLIMDESECVYNDLFDECSLEVGKTLSKTERENKSLNHEKSLIYGEVEYSSFYRVLRKINPAKGLTFYDLGSGTGKAVFIARLTQDFGKCIGIEILHGLHKQAEVIVEKYNRDFKNMLSFGQRNYAQCYEGSLLDFDWSDGDVVFANSTCFDDDLMASLSEAAGALKPGAIVVTFTKGMTSKKFEVLERKRYKMSWGPATVFIHRRLNHDGTPVGPPKLNLMPSDAINYDGDDDAYEQARNGLKFTHDADSHDDDEDDDDEGNPSCRPCAECEDGGVVCVVCARNMTTYDHNNCEIDEGDGKDEDSQEEESDEDVDDYIARNNNTGNNTGSYPPTATTQSQANQKAAAATSGLPRKSSRSSNGPHYTDREIDEAEGNSGEEEEDFGSYEGDENVDDGSNEDQDGSEEEESDGDIDNENDNDNAGSVDSDTNFDDFDIDAYIKKITKEMKQANKDFNYNPYAHANADGVPAEYDQREEEEESQQSASEESVNDGNNAQEPNTKWQQEANSFRKSMNAAREVEKSLEQCPHCNRYFTAEAAERHFPVCSKKPTPLKRDEDQDSQQSGPEESPTNESGSEDEDADDEEASEGEEEDGDEEDDEVRNEMEEQIRLITARIAHNKNLINTYTNMAAGHGNGTGSQYASPDRNARANQDGKEDSTGSSPDERKFARRQHDDMKRSPAVERPSAGIAGHVERSPYKSPAAPPSLQHPATPPSGRSQTAVGHGTGGSASRKAPYTSPNKYTTAGEASYTSPVRSTQSSANKTSSAVHSTPSPIKSPYQNAPPNTAIHISSPSFATRSTSDSANDAFQQMTSPQDSALLQRKRMGNLQGRKLHTSDSD